MPTLRAFATPAFSILTYLTGNRATAFAVASVLPSSTTMTSYGTSTTLAKMDVRQSAMTSAPLSGGEVPTEERIEISGGDDGRLIGQCRCRVKVMSSRLDHGKQDEDPHGLFRCFRRRTGIATRLLLGDPEVVLGIGGQRRH